MASETHKDGKNNFPVKLYRMVEDEDYSNVIWWNEDGNGFFICENEDAFLTSKILENYNFNTNSFSSFVRQLNKYGFHKRRRCYYHDKGFFLRGHSNLLTEIIPTKGNQSTKKETSSKKETGQKLNQQGINQDLSQSIKETETDASLENVTMRSFPGVHGGKAEVCPNLNEGTSVSSQTQPWCSLPSLLAAPSQYSFSSAKNMSATLTIPKRETVHHFLVNTEATSAVSRVGQSSDWHYPVSQIQSFGEITQTPTFNSILAMDLQSDQYMPDKSMRDAGGEATGEQTLPRTGTPLFSTGGFSENMLLDPTTTTLAPSVGDASAFQSNSLLFPIVQQVSTWNSLQEPRYEAGPCEQHLTYQYPMQDPDFPPCFTIQLQNKGGEIFEAGKSSEESSIQPQELCQEIAEASNVTRGFRAHGNACSSGEGGVTIKPKSCRPEGGQLFQLKFVESLPPSVTSAWATFGSYGREKVDKIHGSDCLMFGDEIPAGKPGLVTVTVTTESEEFLGKTVFTYEDPEKKANYQGLSNKSKLGDHSDNSEDLKRFKQTQQGDDGEESRKLAFQQGPLHQAKQLDPDILKPLVYAAAEAGAMRLIEIIFSLPAGRVAFEAYKEDSSLPEDIAEESGHGKVAAYLRNITRRYSEEQSTTPDQSRAIDWLELAKAFDELELNQSEPSSDKEFNQIREDDITETGYSADGETLFPGSETEISDFDDGLNKTSTCKGWSIKLATQRIANISSLSEFHKIDTSSRVRKTVANPAPTIKTKMNNAFNTKTINKKMYSALRRRSRKIKNALRRQKRMTTNYHAS